MPYVVIIPTDNPDVGAAYQAIDYAAAEALAAELVREHGRQAIIAQPIAATQTSVSVARLVADASPAPSGTDAPSVDPSWLWHWESEAKAWYADRLINGRPYRYVARREGRQWVALVDNCTLADGYHSHVERAKAACVEHAEKASGRGR